MWDKYLPSLTSHYTSGLERKESSIYKYGLIPKKKGFRHFLVKNVKFKREKVWNIVLKPSFIDQPEEEKSMHTFSLDLIIVLVFYFLAYTILLIVMI